MMCPGRARQPPLSSDLSDFPDSAFPDTTR